VKLALACLVLFAVTPATTWAAALPEWALSAVRTAPEPPADAHAHLLLHETTFRMPAKGRHATHVRAVLRVLDRQGLEEAIVQVPYARTSARVVDLRAWVRPAEGPVREYRRAQAMDVSLLGALELEQERRELVLVPEGDLVGGILAWEWEVEEDALLSDAMLVFASHLPCARLRYRVEPPRGASVHVVFARGEVPSPVPEGEALVWERRDLPALPDEPASAAWPLWEDRAVVSIEPRGATQGHSFADWASVAQWLADLSAPSLEATPEVSRRAGMLVEGIEPPLERARALARFAQSVNYVAISIGLAHGDGYRPRPAGSVLETGWGDCKDKAGLLCALARSVGLDAWLVTANLDGRDFVDAAWPSPGQFNHCIAAIAIPAGSGLEAAIDDTPLGPIVFFDATDAQVPFGSLSAELAGSRVLVQDARCPELIALPLRAPGRDGTATRLEGSLRPDGTLDGEWRLCLRGTLAWSERARRAASGSEWRAGVERGLTTRLGPCRISRLEVEDRPGSDSLVVTASVEVKRFAKPLGPALVGFRTPLGSGPLLGGAEDSTRVTPIALTGMVHAGSVAIRLPEGWMLDALPRPLDRHTDFGTLTASWSLDGREVRAGYQARLLPVTLPADRIGECNALVNDWAYVNRTQTVVRRP